MNDEKMTEKSKLNDDGAKFLANGGEIKEEPIRVSDMKRYTELAKKAFRNPIQNPER